MPLRLTWWREGVRKRRGARGSGAGLQRCDKGSDSLCLHDAAPPDGRQGNYLITIIPIYDTLVPKIVTKLPHFVPQKYKNITLNCNQACPLEAPDNIERASCQHLGKGNPRVLVSPFCTNLYSGLEPRVPRTRRGSKAPTRQEGVPLHWDSFTV
ncbi:hypothetical protein E2C01_002947 [Portunus trituberculatus]|uniref:Uncharacterized protein n=1 Tax=Portunus trituberculatus TaxID=210409 RepID=A0A5B7CS26_PORTR|nr:hypothetical protein [Portunus trituberculatus]